jgi:hypothetical protein
MDLRQGVPHWTQDQQMVHLIYGSVYNFEYEWTKVHELPGLRFNAFALSLVDDALFMLFVHPGTNDAFFPKVGELTQDQLSRSNSYLGFLPGRSSL